MKHLLLAAAVAACAVPASAQFDAEAVSSLAAAVKPARDLARRLAPAPIDRRTISKLMDRLSKDGDQMESEEGKLENVLGREQELNARGRAHSIEASLVELPAEAVEEQNDSPIRDLVMRRYFSRMEATSLDWRVDPKTGIGRVDEWHFTISLDGKLTAVDHTIVPIEPVGEGEAAPNLEKARAYRMSPSDDFVQRRWKKFSKELLTLGKTISV
jgi:hypothetical protein